MKQKLRSGLSGLAAVTMALALGGCAVYPSEPVGYTTATYPGPYYGAPLGYDDFAFGFGGPHPYNHEWHDHHGWHGPHGDSERFADMHHGVAGPHPEWHGSFAGHPGFATHSGPTHGAIHPAFAHAPGPHA